MYIVTSDDIQIRFIGDGTEQWMPTTVTSIAYDAAPVGAHNPTTRIGQQTWEGLLQGNDPGMGKAIMTIDVAALPDPSKRTMEFRFRVRDDDPVRPFITEWSETNSVKIIGKPGKANMTG
jgi:hypothetical protein